MSNFVHIRGVGIYRESLIKSIVPLANTQYQIEVVPPVSPDDEFYFKLIKNVNILIAINLDNEADPIHDEDPNFKKVISVSTNMTLDEVIEEFLTTSGKKENPNVDKVKTKASNYKKRIKKIHEHERKMSDLEVAKGSPTYDLLVKNLMDDAPSNEGQPERINDIGVILSEALAEIVETDEEEYIGSLALLNSDETQRESILEEAADLLESFYRVKIEGEYFEETDDNNNTENFEDGDYSEDLNAIDRLNALSPETAVSRAEEILNSENTISNKPEELFGEDTDLEDEAQDPLDEDEEEDENNTIEIKP